MTEAPKFPKGNIHLRQEERPQRCIRVTQDVEAIEIDLSRPRLIRILGRTNKGHYVERHLKVTDKERLVLV